MLTLSKVCGIMGNVKKNIICDRCKNKMKVKIEKRNVTDTVTEIFFKCNKCGKDYHICYEDEELRTLRERLERVNKKTKAYNAVIRLKKMIEGKLESLENDMQM